MKKPKAYGIWTLSDEKLARVSPAEDTAKIHDQVVYCPLCRKPMTIWVEGCTIYHMDCDECNFSLLMKETEEDYERLTQIVYE